MMGTWVVYIDPPTFGIPDIDLNSSFIQAIRVGSGHWRNLGMREFLIAAQTSRTSLWQVEIPSPNRFETSRSGSPVASRQMQTATRWRTGIAVRRVVSFLVIIGSSSSQIISKVALLSRNAFRNSSSGKSGCLHFSHQSLDLSFTHNLRWWFTGAPPESSMTLAEEEEVNPPAQENRVLLFFCQEYSEDSGSK
uniref:Uncharacterized protein n=1 Tax=Opuntia streptacantha TaxID=393608 RepID=A0A7C8Z4R6_OPUST